MRESRLGDQKPPQKITPCDLCGRAEIEPGPVWVRRLCSSCYGAWLASDAARPSAVERAAGLELTRDGWRRGGEPVADDVARRDLNATYSRRTAQWIAWIRKSRRGATNAISDRPQK